MDQLELYARVDGYARVAKSEGVDDYELAAVKTFSSLWAAQERGREITPSFERIVLNGHIKDAHRRAAVHAVPIGLIPDLRPGQQTVPRAASRPLTLEETLFADSLREALLGIEERKHARAWALVNLNGLPQREAADLLGVHQGTLSRWCEDVRSQLTEEVVA